MTFPVKLVGGGPGAWDLITLRGAKALQEADVILTDHLGPTDQLDQLIDVDSAEIIDVAKIPYGRSTAQEEINRLLIQHAQSGKKVVRLKGGDPFVFGRGYEEVLALAAAGLEVEVIPGVTSAISVPSAVGVPVTHRGITHAMTIVSGHVAPNDPRSLVNWRALAASGATLCVIMGVKNIDAITKELIDAGLPPATPAAIIQEGTTETQRHARSTLEELASVVAEQGFSSPAVYVIGAVAGQIES